MRKCEDCQLLALLKEFHPDSSILPKIQPHTKKFKVLYFDMPGEDEQSWRREFRNEISNSLNKKYANSLRVYAHLFIYEETASTQERKQYEFVIQYWFFYPFNGGDNKGLDQILSAPGGKNRDSHGTYPFAGHYKGIGPVGATEKINGHLDCDEDMKDSKNFVHFDSAKIVLVPDWERVIELAIKHSEVRSTWSWLLLPIRWGFPAVASPGAGVVKHVDTGNLSSIGPAYNTAWNRVVACDGYDLFDPHAFSANYLLGWQDNFINSWGYLNLTLPTLMSIPPFDLALRLPYKRCFERKDRVFICTESIPFRRIGFASGLYPSSGDDDFARLLPMEENEYIQSIIMKDSLNSYIHSLENFDTFSHKNMGIQISAFMGNKLIAYVVLLETVRLNNLNI